MIRKQLLVTLSLVSAVTLLISPANAHIVPRIEEPESLLHAIKGSARKVLSFADKQQPQEIDDYTPRKGETVPKKIKLHFFSGEEFEGADHVKGNGIAKVNGELLYTDDNRRILRIMSRGEFRYWQETLAKQPDNVSIFDSFINYILD